MKYRWKFTFESLASPSTSFSLVVKASGYQTAEKEAVAFAKTVFGENIQHGYYMESGFVKTGKDRVLSKEIRIGAVELLSEINAY